MNRFYAYALIALAFSLSIAPSAFLAHAEGEQLMGTSECPFGMSWAKWFFNGRLIAAVCMSTAEFERANYTMTYENGNFACRALVIRGKQ